MIINKKEDMYQYFFKRLVDFCLSLLAIICLSPLLLVVIALLYVSNEGAGVFFMQERPGLRGRIFKVIKFKTMNDKRGDDGNLLPDLLRITKVGRFVRDASLDELPQLFNVLKGDMALIGPRPLLKQYLPLYSPEQMRRHEVRPGISGWAQVNGRNNLTWTQKFAYDVWYVDHLSFMLDVKIVYMTIMKVFQRESIDNKEASANNITEPVFDGTN
jgi:lipopolysaccharide/colanic/teichoic acid biosynthesis glycosyltransferase